MNMEFDELKDAWERLDAPVKSSDQIRSMLAENRHPVLKKIRRQLTLEIGGWTVFLICYYTMFDGVEKPWWLNLILIFSVLLPLIHNLVGYQISRHLSNGDTVRKSLLNYLSKVKIYATSSVICRTIFMFGFLLFFSYGLNFDTDKYLLLGVIGILLLIQLFILYRLWANRLAHLKSVIDEFN